MASKAEKRARKRAKHLLKMQEELGGEIAADARQFAIERAIERKHEQEDQDQLARDRGRALGLPARLALHPESGWVPGRMYLRKEISIAQLDAAKEAQKIADDYRKAILAPVQKNGGHGSVHDLDDSEQYEIWCSRAGQRFSELQEVLNKCCEIRRSLAPRHAMQRILFDDREPGKLAGDFREALNEIGSYFLGVEKAA